MTIESADALTDYLRPQITEGLANAQQEKNLVKYKQYGLGYIQACKDASKDVNNVIVLATLKTKILDAVNLLQAYHDAL